jgi:hypothetical protein
MQYPAYWNKARDGEETRFLLNKLEANLAAPPDATKYISEDQDLNEGDGEEGNDEDSEDAEGGEGADSLSRTL